MTKRTLIAVLAAVLTAAVLIASGPRGIATESRRTGTLDLTSHTERGHHQLATFVLTDGTPEFGGLGADEHTEVEIGSVTKMFTVEITQQLIEEGAHSRDTRVGEVLDIGDSPAADITVEELATHTSGLPRLANPNFFRSLVTMGTNGNPYEGETTEDILDAARTAKLENRGTEQYSNFGYALLGALLAEKTGTPYEELGRTRLVDARRHDGVLRRAPRHRACRCPARPRPQWPHRRSVGARRRCPCWRHSIHRRRHGEIRRLDVRPRTLRSRLGEGRQQ